MQSIELPWKVTSDGLLLRVRLTPKASSEGIDGLENTAEGVAVKARVRAVPSDGEANAALTRLIAKWLDLPKSRIALVAGNKSRIKSLAIIGEPEALARGLAARLGN